MPAGRPREFDIDKAIDRAMTLFWRKGYEGTSLTDLTGTLGITRPSLYAAFGSKEGLFRRALDRYVERPSRYVIDALEAPAARQVAERLFRGAIELNTNPRHPGCLMVRDAQACGAEADLVKRELAARLLEGERAIAERFKRAKAEGDLPDDCNPADLARYVRSVVYGIAVQAAAGATAKELHKVADLALRSWPQNGKRGRRRASRAR
jgi:AcrR family transcriptional regulator